jgi:hypothetical protein
LLIESGRSLIVFQCPRRRRRVKRMTGKPSTCALRTAEAADLRVTSVGVAGDDVYGVTQTGLVRWVRDHFEKSTERIEPNDLSRMNFVNQGGWSGRSNLLSQSIGDKVRSRREWRSLDCDRSESLLPRRMEADRRAADECDAANSLES